jgi:oligoendopeptidase F
VVQDYERIEALARRLGGYAGLWFSENTQATPALAYQQRMRKLLSDVSNRTLFFSLWWKALSDEAAARLLAGAGEYRYALEVDRLFKPHTLSEAEEQAINIKDVNGISGIITLYDMITSQYQFTLRVNGRKKTMTRGELQTWFRDPSAARRAAAYREQLRVYGEQGTVLAQMYAFRAQDWEAEQVRLRHFGSPIAVRNLSNDVPGAAVDTLLEVCRENARVFQRYFKRKAGWVGLKQLRRYDIYAPLGSSDKVYPYSEAVEMVLDSYNAFAPQAGDLARRVLAEQHVDSEIRQGKRGGAFCSSVLPTITPYVLLNYAGHTLDVTTMAHELGHAIHSLLASHHSVLTFHPSLPMAETASVFGEMLMTSRLLADERDPGVRRELLASKIDDTYMSIMRQAFFILFEKQAHELVSQGKSVEDLCAQYLENLHEQFGDAVDVSDDFKWEWVSIPHIFHTPFYTYAYSFGNLLTLALYKRYLADGESFKPQYFKILAYGGSASPVNILSEAGIDITSREFWQGGFDVISGWIDELEGLPAPTKPSRGRRAVSSAKQIEK